MKLIRSNIVTYQVTVLESELRAALIKEAAETHGLTHEGKMIPGVTGAVTFDGRRGGGTYTVSLTRDVTASGQAQLPGTGSISNG